jgi:hypothetical protein
MMSTTAIKSDVGNVLNCLFGRLERVKSRHGTAGTLLWCTRRHLTFSHVSVYRCCGIDRPSGSGRASRTRVTF